MYIGKKAEQRRGPVLFCESYVPNLVRVNSTFRYLPKVNNYGRYLARYSVSGRVVSLFGAPAGNCRDDDMNLLTLMACWLAC